jgi:hypothetical protein
MLLTTIAIVMLTFVLLIAVRPQTHRTLQLLWREYVINGPDRPAGRLGTVSVHAQRSMTNDVLVGLTQIIALVAGLVEPLLLPAVLVLCFCLAVRTMYSTAWLHLQVRRLAAHSEDAGPELDEHSEARSA